MTPKKTTKRIMRRRRGMKENIYKTDTSLVIVIPLTQKRSNPYDDREWEGENVIAIIENDDDTGFCYRIDMSYKGKPDQWSDYFFKWMGDKAGFEKLCKELKIDVVYY